MAPKSAAPAKPQPVRILVVDDHPIVREGLVKFIQREADLQVCGEAENAAEALRLAEQLKPDLVIMDLTLKESSGLEAAKDLRLRRPNLPVLVLSMHDENVYAERALKAGARGYLMKDQARASVVTAIRQVLAGEIYLSPRMAQNILSKVTRGSTVDASSPVDILSDRELEVFRLIGQGHSTKQIAIQLHRSIRTIDAHRENIKHKLNLSGAPELLQRAILWTQSEQA